MPMLGRANTGGFQKTDDPKLYYECLVSLCNDNTQGIGYMLTSLQNGSKSLVETMTTITEKLQLIIKMGESGTLMPAFEIGLTTTSHDKPSQRLEWLLLSTLAPILATSALASIHSELVVGALTTVGAALASSEGPYNSAHTATPGSPRTRAYSHAILGILKEVTQHLNIATFPSDCHVRMSVFKGTPSHEHDPTWATFRFTHIDDAIAVVSLLLSLVFQRNCSASWPAYKSDDEHQLALLKVARTLIDLFLPNGILARKDRSGSRHISATTSSIIQLYQACSHCVREAIPLMNCDYRYYPLLAQSILEILHHHVMTIDRRCTEWNAGAGNRTAAVKMERPQAPDETTSVILGVKEYRKEVPAVATLETILAECLTSVSEYALRSSPNTFEFYGPRLLAVSLLFSDQLLLLSEDESGKSVQRAILQLAIKMAPSGFFVDPLGGIEYVLKNFIHLELGLLVELVNSCLENYQGTENTNEQGRERSEPVKKPSHTLEYEQGHVMSSFKRSLDDIEYDQLQFGSPEWSGKRARRDSPAVNLTSLESVACSSIVSASQFSQWPARHQPGGHASWTPSEHLLDMLKKFTDHPTFGHAASQGSRGVQPQLSVNDLRTITIILHLWTRNSLSRETQGAELKIDLIAAFVENIGKQYLRWALSPGMQNASLNQSYLESSYTLVLDIVALMAPLNINESFKELLICLSSGPWFTDISDKEFWPSTYTDTLAFLDDTSGEHQLANAVAKILDKTEILARLRDNPSLLQSSRSFLSQKCKAMLVMSTLPYCPQLADWRAKVIVDTLKASYSNPEHPCAESCDHSPVAVAIESLSVLSSTSPNLEPTIETVLDNGIEDDLLITLAASLGAIACGVSTMDRDALPACSYDVLTQCIIPRRACFHCSSSLQDNAISSIGASDLSGDTGLSLTFLHPFQWLIRTCASESSRLALLDGLYRVFCHLDLRGEDLRSIEFGKFLLGQLDSPSVSIRKAAGDVVELLAKRAGAILADDPLGCTALDGTLTRIGEVIAKGFAGSLKTRRLADFLQLCRRVMRHLPEEYPVYHGLLGSLIDQVFTERTVFRSDLVYEEMSKIAQDKNLSRFNLLRPQIELVCGRVIEKLNAGQERWLESLYAWTDMGQSRFLKQNLSGIVPKLITLGSRDLIEKLATLLKVPEGELCMDNLEHILIGIFMEQGDVIQPSVELLRSLLSQVEQGQGAQRRPELLDIVSLITLSKIGLLGSVSLELGHENPATRDKVRKIIEIVEEHDWQQVKQQNLSKKEVEKRSLALFLKQHILAIMSDFNKAFMGRGPRVTFRTKAKYLRSLSVLVKLLHPIQSTVLSQIFSPLNAVLNTRELRIHALRVLKSIVDSVEPIRLEALLAHLVQSLGDLYLKSNKSEQAIITSILEYLLIRSQDELQPVLPDVGALPNIPEFKEMNRVLRQAKAAGGFEGQLRGLIGRLGNENSELAKQAALELREFLLANEQRVLVMATSKEQATSELMSNLVLALLSEIGRFRGLDAPVPMACAECLGIVGAIDPERISGRRLTQSASVYPNFNDIEEARNFVCELIAVQLVGKSRSIGDIPSESHWAFALQNLLSFCGITKDVLEAEPATNLSSRTLLSQRSTASSTPSYCVSNSSGQPSKRIVIKSPKERWRAFPRHVQEVLELLIDAKYAKTEFSIQKEYSSPLYPQVKTFQEWLACWTRTLTAKVTGLNARDIFQACKHVFPYDAATCLYLLPHLVLNVLIEGTENDRREIVTEMAAVLGDGEDWREDGGNQAFGVTRHSLSELHQLGSQTVFALFDHIAKWIHQRRNSPLRVSGVRGYTTSVDAAQRFPQDETLRSVQNHLSSISHEVLAKAAFRGKAYARALFHFEQQIRDLRRSSTGSGAALSELGLQKMYEQYQELYVWMDEPDGMEGMSSLITSGSLSQYLLQCESAGRWEEAHAYYELGIQSDPLKFDNHCGLYKALDNLGQFDTLLNGVEGCIWAHPDWEQALNDFRISASWKSQRWESLGDALSRSVQSSFQGGLGQLVLDLKENRVTEFEEHLNRTRSMLIAPLAAAGMESYSRAYDHVVQLHMLHELEVAFHSWNRTISPQNSLGSQIAHNLQGGDSYTDRLRQYQPKFARRVELMAPSFKTREQVVMLRRVAFYHIRMPDDLDDEDAQYLADECGRLWLESARTARKSRNDQMSYSAMLHAENLGNTSAVIERVKWGFSHDNERQAIKTIDSALARKIAPPPSTSGRLSRASSSSRPKQGSASSSSGGGMSGLVYQNTDLERVRDHSVDKTDRGFIRAKAILLRTRWMDKSSLVNPYEITDGFRQASAECDRWEKTYYVAGQYFFKLYESTKRSKTRQTNLGYATQGCKLYGKALTVGPKYLYQILPRLLTYWLDLGRHVHLLQTNPKAVTVDYPGAKPEFVNINILMEELADHLPEYMFLSAFPQIISRICHKNSDAFAVLQRIICKVVLAYPDQAIWQMVSVSRSIVPERKRVCNRILNHVRDQLKIGPAIAEQVREALDLCDNLITLCMAPVPERVSRLSLERHFPRIFSQLKQGYNVTVPGQNSLWPSLPKSSETMASHQPFKAHLPKIDRFLDEVDVMSSLQKPRKITVAGSDGQHYTFLCKPKDDLRKDAKVVEFNNLVNMLLRKNRETNRRDMYIRTYAVIPLNEECGLIEWVHHTMPYRHLIQKQYKLNNIVTPPFTDIRKVLEHEDHVRLFTKELLPRFPSLFYQWFKDITSEPNAWFAARLRFTRTAAVMSMVGHIVGLGDRHGENLLLDERNGDVVHVDFNCLFEQGKQFPKPEKVPFRLTHNMVDAMGLSGYDGAYRLACEKTLGVFRENTDSLVSVLEGFLHDPLVEWSKSRKKDQKTTGPGTGARGEPVGGVKVENGGEDTRARLLRGGGGGAGVRSEAKAPGEMRAVDGEPYDEAQADEAYRILVQIKRKLNGADSGLFALSVAGQVEELIQNATSISNLSNINLYASF
ncbi:serine/threonine-protein kinase M1 [Mortierella sp. GBA35]|nr:serine/threonine-protein kinase M1 [Mortierella sp. GBA35]